MNADHSHANARELQLLEHSLQQILVQRQSLQLELNELTNALKEIEKSSDPVYRVMGSIMVKADKTALAKELTEKKSLVEAHMQSIEKQEKLLHSKMLDLKKKSVDDKSTKKSSA